MAHNTLISGTGRAITGGTDLIGGTAYKRKKGRTLVGGTGYDIAFDGGKCKVTITGTGNSNVNVTINGVKYTSATEIEVEPGIVMACYVYSYNLSGHSEIWVGGTRVVSKRGGSVTYSYTIQSDISVELLIGHTTSKITITE